MAKDSDRKFKEIFSNINTSESSLLVDRDILVVAGRFGVAFCKITGKGLLSAPVLYRNIKDLNYRTVYDAQLSYNYVLLSTNKGVFKVVVPNENEFTLPDSINAKQDQQWILHYDTFICNVKNNDSFKISQSNLTMLFDVVNPYGVGKLRFLYRVENDSSWTELNANELVLPHLEEGRHYNMYIMAYDDVWRSQPFFINIYVKPYWWQLLFKSRWFWSGAVLVFLGLCFLIVFITQRVVTRNNFKKNMRLELELKSVYSQINPHFIFNTLTSALFFIKKKRMEEAYDHVSKFSRLLRAYIKSSRNKYISLSNEIENLDRYIQLQQVRFDSKFDYEIAIDKDIDASKVNIPALLLQPIVENAIDHGLFHKEAKGNLKIKFERTGHTGDLKCSIEDDGIGRDEARKLARQSLVKSESYGDTLINELVSIFNKYEKMNIAIRYIDKRLPETGTIVIVTIKNPLIER